jgi:molybdopterin biosynthesis enzyme MoaB
MIRVAVLTLSDRGFRGEREDLSGQEIRNIVAKIEADIVSHDILPDEKDVITGKLIDLCGKAGLKKTSYSMLSRAVAGVRNETLIINLPGSPRAVRENLKAVIECLPHAIEKIRGSDADCAPPGSKGEKRA